MNDNKLISIITVVYNSDSLIRQTIESVVCQSNYAQIEYIVIDGNSKDQTINIINEYSTFIDVLISENDLGIYDAMNKGLKYANGEWVLFLNAGDCLIPNDIINIIKNNFNTIDEIIYGNIVVQHMNNNKRIKPASLFAFNYKMPFCHQAVLVKKILFTQYSIEFDTSYKVAADYKLFYTFYKKKCKFKYLDVDISNYDLTGQSFQNPFLYHSEVFKIINSKSSNIFTKYFKNSLFVLGNLKPFFYIIIKKNIFNN